MWIKKLELYQFRNYKTLSLEFEKGVNVIIGDNGEGKTSLVEAIGMFPFSKSLRTNDEKELIQLGEQFTKIEGVFSKEFEEKIKIVISKQKKVIEINDSEVKKVSSLAGIVKVVSFLPKDVELFKGSPSNRRRFIDYTMAMLDKNYLLQLNEYNKLLESIRESLKEDIDYTYLEVLVKQLCERGRKLQIRRSKYLSLLNEELKSISKYIEKDENKIEVLYRPDIDVEDIDEEKYFDKVWNKLKQSLEVQRNARGVIKGIHQDDIQMNFEGKNLSMYGSQGENRISVIALKLALIKMMKITFKEEPIVILDDVLSELDENHQRKLIQLLNRIEQVFITGTKINFVEKYTLYNVKDNVVRRKS